MCKRACSRRKLRKLLLALLAASVVCASALWFSIARDRYGDGFDNSLYQPGAFAGVKAMVIVPHQDDELNLAGSTMHLLVQGGADVRVVFSTNSDYKGLAEIRLREAERALAAIGIPRENLIFLGYGDGWADYSYHLYSHGLDEPALSHSGRSETYGAAGFPDFRSSRDGRPSAYTLRNFQTDLKDAIVSYMPDILFCIDLDEHPDHRALSLTFDRVMGRILSEQSGYRPAVCKGFTYDTAWYAPMDYYAKNIPSTRAPAAYRRNDARYATDTPPFLWENRVRFPMPADMLAYTLRANRMYDALGAYASQMGALRMEMAVSGDQVFWRRNTHSLLYANARISASSGDARHLNDFLLLDSGDIESQTMTCSDCFWIPDASDAQKSVFIQFNAPVDLDAVSLYDNCSLEDNILSGELRFGDGSTVPVGPLNPSGAETRIPFDKKTGVTSLTFSITKCEGDSPGLAEIEAFCNDDEAWPLPTVLKLAAAEGGDFLYRYWAEPGETIPLSVYQYPLAGSEVGIRALSPEDGAISISGNTVSVAADASPGVYRVRAALATDASVYDEIEIWIPTFFEELRWHLDTLGERLYNKTVGKLVGTARASWILWRYGDAG